MRDFIHIEDCVDGILDDHGCGRRRRRPEPLHRAPDQLHRLREDRGRDRRLPADRPRVVRQALGRLRPGGRHDQAAGAWDSGLGSTSGSGSSGRWPTSPTAVNDRRSRSPPRRGHPRMPIEPATSDKNPPQTLPQTRLSPGGPSAMTRDPNPRLLVSLATYNEAGNLRAAGRGDPPRTPRRRRSWSSTTTRPTAPAGSPTSCRRTLPGHPRHPPRRASSAWARPILAGMRYAIEHGYDYLLNLDADFSHPPRFIPALLAGMARPRRDDRLALRPGRRGRGRVQPQAQVHEHAASTGTPGCCSA